MEESADNRDDAASAPESYKSAGAANWGTTAVIGLCAGMLYGGSKEAAASVSKDAEVMLKMGSTPDKREQYRLMRDAMEKRTCLPRNEVSMMFGMRWGLVRPQQLHLVFSCQDQSDGE
ncbi:hypothetical protein MLD38_013365 [Melastoma candidum]|uniref:Uncharacterized protein n=1 Tax=Melastoma candidum TaxID=119954 RepID=A0ACB9RAH9_9MYRT|nr:hypothetical protein MLD38_013365 [Melastoma candidum]